jgi:hypothetical protein
MKNVLALSLLCTTLVSASLHAEKPLINEEFENRLMTVVRESALLCDTASMANAEELIQRLGEFYTIESVGADGRIHILIAADAFNYDPQVGNVIGIIGGATYQIASIEPSENPAYLRLILLVVAPNTCSEQEEQE